MIGRNATIRSSVPKARRGRGGVTLVELLVTITILGILGSAVVFASFGANRAARVAATQAKVASLHSLLSEKYDEFRTRRVDVPMPNFPGSADQQWKLRSQWRLTALRALMRMEMPDRWSDVVCAPVNSFPPRNSGRMSDYPAAARIKTSGSDLVVPRTALSQAYLRRYDGLKTTDEETILLHQGAECLYMIITLATADGEALGMFRQSDIGDVDGDGAPEFLDAFGNPINYLHAAPGFTPWSDLQSGDPVADHDPIDVYRVDTAAYRLSPLIYSAGPDGDYDLLIGGDLDVMAGLWQQSYYTGDVTAIGSPVQNEIDGEAGNWVDNIHNHDQSARL